MSKEILSLITGLLAVVLIVYGSFCLIRLAKKLRNRQEVKYITITPEDVGLIRDALVHSYDFYNKLYEKHGQDFEKDLVDKIKLLQRKFTTIATQSSAIIEVFK